MHLDVAIFIGRQHQHPEEEVYNRGAIEGRDRNAIVAQMRRNRGPIADNMLN